ncbi:acyl-CoA dehydrogenase [Aquabacterium soli]|uniref:Acyl-CoA dehydrogenase n=1 Tax=Aquabacterium soli TaxID=2493092 RepID=A0A426V9K9_9BURK|nr:acyl-CoA dehydrogenase family protein [Aquabacterium soli]RRS03647.1 acyl-CoA dehydrogenase [Aquabacterium soli]
MSAPWPAGLPPLPQPIAGHLPPEHPLSPRRALQALDPKVRLLLAYAPQSAWDTDTASLPRRLQRYRRQARAFAQTHLAPAALAIDAGPHLPAGQMAPEALAILREAGRQGWLSDLLPAPLGSCPWLDAPYPMVWRTCLKVEEFARACGGLMLLLCAHFLGMGPILVSGQLPLMWRTLRPATRANLRGDPHLFAFAITEPGAGSDAEDGHGAATNQPGLVARRQGDGWCLNGQKVFISGGDIARQITVFAALEGEGFDSWTCFLVDSRSPGFRAARTELKMGMRASSAAHLVFDNVWVSDACVVGGLRSGWSLNRATLNLSRLPVGAMAVGLAQAAVDIAVHHACTQRLGGRPLIDFQDVQLALADMMAATSAARTLVWQGARTWTPRQAVASMAKFHNTDTALRVIEQAMDLLGEHAVLHRNRLEKLYRDARVTQIFEGTNQINRLAVIEDHQEALAALVASKPA